VITTHRRACVCRSGFRKFVRERAKKRGARKRCAHFEDGSALTTQCPRCDKGQHARCLRLQHCTAKQRSPPGINKRKQARAALKAAKAAAKKVKLAFDQGVDSWLRRLRHDDGGGPGNGGGLGGGHPLLA